MLAELLGLHRGVLLAQARYHSSGAADAEDALGDACLAFLRNYNGPPGQDALYWMKALVKYSAWAIGRRARTGESGQHPESVEQGGGEIPDSRAEPEALYLRREEVEEIAALFEQLKPDERIAMLLLGLGYSYKEIGELRGWTQTKVNRCLSEGRQRIRKLLIEGEGERP